MLCGREDRFDIPRDTSDVDLPYMNLTGLFKTRILSVSELGRGEANLPKKTRNILHGDLSESSSLDDFNRTRCEVTGVVADRGIEADIVDNTVRRLPEFSDTYCADDNMNYTFPNALDMPGHLHFLYGGFERCVKQCPGFKDWEAKLRSVEGFLSDASLRKRFVALHLTPSQGKQFEHYPVVHVDFEWEFAARALDNLMPLLKILVAKFNAHDFLADM